jgi:hypothetical protein
MIATKQLCLAAGYLFSVFGHLFTSHDCSNEQLQNSVWIWRNWAELQNEIVEIKELVEDAHEWGALLHIFITSI